MILSWFIYILYYLQKLLQQYFSRLTLFFAPNHIAGLAMIHRRVGLSPSRFFSTGI